MAEITRLSGCTYWIELDFVKREQTPSDLMKIGIRYHLSGLSLSNTVRELENFGVNAHGRQFTTGCKRQIYSQLAMQARITSR